MYRFELTSWNGTGEERKHGTFYAAPTITEAESKALYDLRHEYGRNLHARACPPGVVFAEIGAPARHNRRSFALVCRGEE